MNVPAMALTRFREGSLGELGTISVPLVLSSLSMMVMIFIDRLLLAAYSTDAMNAATNASTFGWSLLVGAMILTGIAEVFVAQSNGAGDLKKLGIPVWQMLWIAVGSFAFFLPVSLWGAQFIFAGSPYYALERDYFEVMILFGPAQAMYTALAAFWIGRGKTGLITLLAIAANLVNAGLDYVLIFGIDGIVPSMGTRGAAIATSIGAVFQAAVLFFLFLRRDYREKYNTGDCSFDLDVMLSCFKIGLPSALFTCIEVVGWGMFYRLMTRMGPEYITVASIAQSFAILLWAFAEGLSKAAVTVAGNMIGAKKADQVYRVLRSGGLLIAIVYPVYALALYLGIDLYIAQFVNLGDYADPTAMRKTFHFCLWMTIGYSFCEAIRFGIGGVLTAAGDTVFLMMAGTAWIWLALILPVELLVVRPGAPVETAFVIWFVYASSAATVNYLRFRSGKWRAMSIAA